MLPYLNLGPVGLPTGPLIYLLGMWLALFAVDRAARRVRSVALQRVGEGRLESEQVRSDALQRVGEERIKALNYKLNPETYYALASLVLLAGFIGARLAFVLLHWSSYDDNLLGVVWPLNTGYNAFGGVVIAAAAAFFYARWRRLPLWIALDVLTPGVLVFLMAVALADFLSGSSYGSLTAMPWGVNVFGVRRHAVQLYEALASVGALAAWWAATSPRVYSTAGRPFLIAVAVYAAGRLFMDAYRENATLISGFHVVQIASLIVLVVALTMLARGSSSSASTAG